MKTIPGNIHMAGTLRAAALLELDLAGGTYRFTDRAWGPAAAQYRPKIVELGEIVLAARSGGQDEARVTLENTTSIDGVRVLDLWDDTNPVELREARIAYLIGLPSSATRVDVFRGVVAEVVRADTFHVELRLLGRGHKIDQDLGSLITKAEWPDAPEASIGKLKPIVFGTLPNFTPVKVQENATARLTSALLRADTVVQVDTLEGFPSSGTIVVDEETITYTGLGSLVFTGLTRSAPTSHPAGAPVVESGPETWLVAGHALQRIRDVKLLNRDRKLIDPEAGSYTIALATRTIQFAKTPMVDGPASTRYADVDLDAVGPSNSATNPTYAAGRHQDFEETNYATIAAGQRLDLKRTASVPQPGRGRIRRAMVAVEHFGVISLAPPSNTRLYVDDVLQGQLSSSTRFGLPEEIQQEARPYALAKGFEDTHSHQITGTPTPASRTESIGFVGSDASRNNWTNKAQGYDGSAATAAELVPVLTVDLNGTIEIHAGIPDLELLRWRVKSVGLVIIHGTINRATQQEAGSFSASVTVGTQQAVGVGFSGSNAPDVAVASSESGDILSRGLTLRDFYQAGASGSGPGQVTITHSIASLSNVFALRDVRVTFELLPPAGPDDLITIEQKPQTRPSYFWTDGDSSVRRSIGSALVFAWSELIQDPQAIIREVYCAVDPANLGATGYSSIATVGWSLRVSSVVHSSASTIISGRDLWSSVVRLVPFAGTTVSSFLSSGTITLSGGGNLVGSEVSFAFVIEPVASLGTSTESPLGKSSLTVLDYTGPVSAFADLVGKVVSVRSDQFQQAEQVRVLRAWWLLEYDEVELQVASGIACTVEGLAPGGDPTDAIKAIYTDLLGQAASDVLDESALATARAKTVAAGLLCAGAVTERMESVRLVAHLASEFRLAAWWELGKLRVLYLEVPASLPAAARTLSALEIEQDSMVLTPRPAEDVINKVSLRYARNWIEGDYDELLEDEDAASIAKYGRPKLHEQNLDFVRDSTTAGKLRDHLFGRFATAARVARLAAFLNILELERGDVIAWTYPLLNATKAEIQGVSLKPGGGQEIDRVELEAIVRS